MFSRPSPLRAYVLSTLCYCSGLCCCSDAAAQVNNTINAARELAGRLDESFRVTWKTEGVTPVPICSESEFVRRIHLDLIGRIPSPSETQQFLLDDSSDKRASLIDHLLEHPAHHSHQARTWRELLIPNSAADPQLSFLVPGFEAWLREQSQQNTTYSDLVAALLNSSAAAPGVPSGASPTAFLQANLQPEEMASAASRTFLGIRLECAQCHDHPFASWKRDQFWEFAAFFVGSQQSNNKGILGALQRLYAPKGILIPGTNRTAEPRFLDGGKPDGANTSALAGWMTARENPYFSRALVNRLWAQFFGVGLVDPVDDMEPTNPAAYPEVLDLLASECRNHQFDLEFLIRAITNTRAYQLTSAFDGNDQGLADAFARMNIRALTGAQLWDSLTLATGFQPRDGSANPVAFNRNSQRAMFLERFDDQGEPTKMQTSILQALALMNGRITEEVTHLDNSASLAAVCDTPFLSTKERIDSLFLAALSRYPSERELELALKHAASDDRSERSALSDIFWALLNSLEFRVNH